MDMVKFYNDLADSYLRQYFDDLVSGEKDLIEESFDMVCECLRKAEYEQLNRAV